MRCGHAVLAVLVSACGDGLDGSTAADGAPRVDAAAGTDEDARPDGAADHGWPALALLATLDTGAGPGLAVMTIYPDGHVVDHPLRLGLPARPTGLSVVFTGDFAVLSYGATAAAEKGIVYVDLAKDGSAAEVISVLPIESGNGLAGVLQTWGNGQLVVSRGPEPDAIITARTTDGVWGAEPPVPCGEGAVGLYEVTDGSLPERGLLLRRRVERSEIVPIAPGPDEIWQLAGTPVVIDQPVSELAVHPWKGLAYAPPASSAGLLRVLVEDPETYVWSERPAVPLDGGGSQLAISRDGQLLVVLAPVAGGFEIQTVELADDGTPVPVAGPGTTIAGTVRDVTFGEGEILVVAHETAAGSFVRTLRRAGAGTSRWDELRAIEIEGAPSRIAVGYWTSDTD
jgi:hypothetical protein